MTSLPRDDGARAGFFDRVAALRGMIDDIAEVDWRHPLWWALIGSAAALGGRASRTSAYLASGGEPDADTFMGWPAIGAATLAAAIADAIVDAHAAATALVELDGELPDQRLRCHLVQRDGTATPTPIDDARDVVFVLGDRAVRARLADSGPAADATLATVLARIARGEHVLGVATIARDDLPPRAAIAAVVGVETLGAARHLHRRGWSRLGGPWLGVGRAADVDGPARLAIASTCHLVVDGYGHAWITSRIAAHRAATRAALAPLTTAAAAIVGDAATPPLPAHAIAADPLGIASRRVGPLPRLPVLGHALGQLLWLDGDDPRARTSPTFQVPVAPGATDDPIRLRRRVVPVLLSVRFSDEGAPEPIAAFGARARAAIAREAAGDGLMARLAAAAQAAPAPLAWKRRAVAGGRPGLFAPAARVLGGRACLSLLRLGAEAVPAPPLVAVSSPALAASPRDPIGSSVITVVADPDGATVTVSGTGRTGSAAAAAELLDRWLALVDREDRGPS